MPKIHINAARINAGMSQEDLASRMGVSRQTVIAWEQNKREMTTPQVFMFCSITEFSSDGVILPQRYT